MTCSCPPVRDSDGFTIVELMVVVALVGLLAAVSIPNYLTFSRRARQAEAKIALSALFTAETAFAVEQNSFSRCVREMGSAGEGGASANRYYSVGFNAHTGFAPLVCGSGNQSCALYDFTSSLACSSYCGDAKFWCGIDATIIVNRVDYNSPTNAGPLLTQDFLPSSGRFLGVAWGSINPVGKVDIWTIDEKKELTNIQSGI